MSLRIEIETQRGRVAGRSAHGITVFRGIPFAEAPAGALRFAPPIPRSRWNGVLDATKRAPAAPHVASDVGEVIGLTDDFQREDCLHATLWMPAHATSRSRLPVMVWIHGGGFESGSAGNPLADGSELVRRGGVVVVSLQYRIGITGFLSVDGGSSNRGILDLVLGLEWVHREVEAFGGDPSNITLFGSSAGGASVAALLAIPEGRACVRRAIIQSGSAECFQRPESVDRTRAIAAEVLRCGGDGSELRLALEGLELTELLNLQRRVIQRREDETGTLTFAPWYPGAPFTAPVLTSLARGDARGIPLLVGSNADEMKLAALRNFPVLPPVMRLRQLRDRVTALLGDDVDLADRAIALYRKHPSSGSGSLPTGVEERSTNDIYDAISTDLHFRIPAVRIADAHARSESRTYRYVLSWPSPQFGPVFGTPHAMEIPLVFATYGTPPMPIFLGTRPSLKAMSARMQDVWLAFARNGNPSTVATGIWSPTSSDRRVRMTLGETCREEVDLAPAELSFWHDAFVRLRATLALDTARSAGPLSRVSTLFPAAVDP